MGIKRKIISINIVLMLFFLNTVTVLISFSTAEGEGEWPKQYIDKVYTFEAVNSVKVFDLEFREHYYYHFFCELVTPNDNVNITLYIKDPNGIEFKIYNASMFFDPENGRSFSVPFGTAKNGTYQFKVFVQTEYNLNLHIRINEGAMCLYDKVLNDVYNKTVQNGFNIDCISSGIFNTKEYQVYLINDTMYRILASRVTPIAIDISAYQAINLTITDPNSKEFLLIKNYTQLPIDLGYAETYFGAAKEGFYKLKFGLSSLYPIYNFGYLMYEHHHIGEAINETQADEINNPPNQTDSNNTDTNSTFYFIIPETGYILMAAAGIGIVSLSVIAVQVSRKNVKRVEREVLRKPPKAVKKKKGKRKESEIE